MRENSANQSHNKSKEKKNLTEDERNQLFERMYEEYKQKKLRIEEFEKVKAETEALEDSEPTRRLTKQSSRELIQKLLDDASRRKYEREESLARKNYEEMQAVNYN